MGGRSDSRTVGRSSHVWTADAVAGALGVPAPDRSTFSGVSTDTRQLNPRTLFVALTGERFDAHDFLADAKAKGAAAAVVRSGTRPIEGLPFFEVEDTLAALGLLARARRQLLAAGSPVVAVTGSSGKTGTKEMIRAVLGTTYRVHATSGNLNNLVGVPLTILGAPDDAEALVVEAGASVPGEIARLRDVIEPTVAVITNVGYAHVEGFGSLAGVMQEKLALLDGARVAVVGTDPAELAVEARRRVPTIVAGTGPAAEVRPDAAELDAGGHARITWRGSTVTLPVVGFHQIENAMPASLRWAVKFAHWLAGRRGRPLAVVVGSMLELGRESGRLHAAAAAEIAALDPALVAAVGAFAAAFEPYRATLGDRLITAPDVEALGPRLRAALKGDEVVLLKASRGVALERVLRHLN